MQTSEKQNEVYIEINDDKFIFLFDTLQINIIFSDGNIYPVSELPEEILFIKLLRQQLDVVNQDNIVDIGGDLIPILTNYCICCGNDLEYP